MPSIGQTTRPGYVYDSATDTWIPIGIGPHTHASTDLSGVIANSIVDAKADLITATADNTPARLAAGNNGESLVVDSSTATGLRWQGSIEAGKNFVIGGGFDFWQRGTSFTNPFSVYTADRWVNTTNGAVISQQSSGAPAGSRFYMRSTTNASNTYSDIAHYFETNQISPLWGRTVTLSFKLRKSGVAFAGTYIVNLQRSSTVDAGSGASWTTITGITVPTENIASGTGSSDWSTFSFTTTIPNDGTANSLRIVGGYGTTQASGVVIDIAQVQLEIGSVATTFSRAGGTIAGELAACQRYYREMNTQFGYICSGTSVNSTDTVFALPMPSPMRVNPTLTVSANSDFDLIGSATRDVTSFNTVGGKNNFSVFDFYTTVASGQTAGHSATLFPDGANARFRLSAEL